MILNLLRRHKDTKKRVSVKKPSHPAFPMHEISTFAHHTPFAVRDYRIKKGTAYIIMMNFIKKLLFAEEKQTEDAKQKKELQNFDILKYDGIRAQNIGKWIYAEKCFKEALRIHPDPETLTMLVRTSIRLNKMDQAHDLLKEAIATTPEQTQYYLELAQVCYMQEQYSEMLNVVQEAARRMPEDAVPYYLQAQAYQKLGDAIHAIATLTQAICKKEDFTEAYLMRCRLLLDMYQVSEAQADMEILLQKNPDDEETLLLAGEIQQRLNDTPQAISFYRKIIELNPFHEKAYEQLASLFANESQWEKAIEVLDEAIDINATSNLYQLRGRLKLEKGDKDGSLEDMKKALELSPEKENAINGHFDNQSPS